MKKINNMYITVFKLTWKQATDYRFDFIFELVCGFIPVIVLIMLWNAVYDNKSMIGEYTQTMMISYVICARFINIVLLPEFFFDVTGEIQSGNIITYLSKPINYKIYWFFKGLGHKSKNFIIGLIPIIMISIIYDLSFINNLNISNLCLFAGVLIFSYLIYFLVFMIISLLSFWFYDISSWYYTVVLAIELFAGAIIPFSLFPSLMKSIMNFMPFKYLVSFPVDTLIGALETKNVIMGLFVQIIWIAILLMILEFIWKKGIKKFEANGG